MKILLINELYYISGGTSEAACKMSPTLVTAAPYKQRSQSKNIDFTFAMVAVLNAFVCGLTVGHWLSRT